jgi:hypothetical protein
MNNKTFLYQNSKEDVVKKYHQLTSPLLGLEAIQKKDVRKIKAKDNMVMRMQHLKGQKIDTYDKEISFVSLKAGS